jgi:hypothetical protein
MDRAAFGVLCGLALAGILGAGCGGGSPVPTASHRATSTTGRTVILTAEKVTVSPRTSLQDGQAVTVKVQGFKPGVPEIKFFLSECQSPLQVNRLGCGKQLAAQPFGLTDSQGSGSGSVSFTVQSHAATQALSAALAPCAGTCVIVATTGASGIYGFAPIDFSG